MFGARDLKKTARKNLSERWGRCIVLTLLCFVLGVYSLGPIPTCVYTPEELAQNYSLLLNFKDAFIFDISTFRSFLFFILGAVFLLGESKCYLQLCDGKDFKIKDVFSELPSILPAIGLRLARYAISFIGFLVFIIPGIYFHYIFCFSSYLMAEDNTLSITGALKKSRSLTKGHVFELLLVDMSLLGWVLLCCFTMGLGLIFLVPYQRSCRMILYRRILSKFNREA